MRGSCGGRIRTVSTVATVRATERRVVEVAGAEYTIKHLTARTYPVRASRGNELVGMFLLDIGHQGFGRVLGAEGMDVATTLLVAETALDAGLLPM